MVLQRNIATTAVLMFALFLLVSTLILVILLLTLRDELLPQLGQCSTLDAEVLILGAGMSGIVAAKTLQDNGTRDFIIIEAQSEMGGRMKLFELRPGVVIELGANWIEGIDPLQPERHPLYALAEQCGGLNGSYADAITVYNSTGHNIVSQLRNATIRAAYGNLDKLKAARLRQGLPDISMREGLRESGWEVVSDGDKWLDWFSLDFCFAESPERTSLYANVPEPTYYDFGNHNRTTTFLVSDQSGYVKLVHCLAGATLGKRDRRLHLNETVTEVSWHDDCVCAVTVNSSGSYKYCARSAILTFSLGVLKSQAVKFQPGLPQWKLDAIAAVDMTNYLKIFAEFPTVFWDSVPYIGYAGSERGYYSLFIAQNLFLPPGSNLLHITLTGALADRAVLQPRSATSAQILRVLRNVYGEQVPEPTRLIVADWKTDPLFYGTYSNFPTGVTADTVASLAAPLGRLYFSGEATSFDYAGFVHGAYFAGIDTANKVLQDSLSSLLLPASRYLVLFIMLILFST